jgi:hypothetical protein
MFNEDLWRMTKKGEEIEAGPGDLEQEV